MFVADVIITVITINNLTKRVKLMNDIAKKIHNVSTKSANIFMTVPTIL